MWFVLTIIDCNCFAIIDSHIERNKNGVPTRKNEAKVNLHLLLEDLELYGNNDKEIDFLIKTVWQCSKDIKIEFGILKCAVVSL